MSLLQEVARPPHHHSLAVRHQLEEQGLGASAYRVTTRQNFNKRNFQNYFGFRFGHGQSNYMSSDRIHVLQGVSIYQGVLYELLVQYPSHILVHVITCRRT